MKIVSPVLTAKAHSGSASWIYLLFFGWIVGGSFFLFNAKNENMRLFVGGPDSVEVYFERQDFADSFTALSAQTLPLNNSPALDYAALTNPLPVRAISNATKATLIHFWNPDCDCDLINQKHVETLLSKYQQQIRFIVVSDARNEAKFRITWQTNNLAIRPRFVATSELTLPSPIPASPAVAVLSADHQLIYVGPYAVGGFCLPNDNGIVETILTRLASGQVMKYPFMNGIGCFCPWPAGENTKQGVI